MVALKTNENFGRLMQVLWGEKIVECNMKYSYVVIEMFYLLLMFHVLCLTNTIKFEFANKKYLYELMQTLK